MPLYIMIFVVLMSMFSCTEDTSSQADGMETNQQIEESTDDEEQMVDADMSVISDNDATLPMTTASSAGDVLFDRQRLIEIEIELAPEDWTVLRNEGRGFTQTFTGCEGDFEYTYMSAQVTVDGQTYEDVAVRKKGFLGSISVIRPSLKLNFGRLVEGRTHDGMKRMTLNNNKQDPSHTHQCMAYDLFRRAGSMAPRCNFAHVTVNGEDLGIYTHVESIKKPMLARYFENNDGNLYEGQGTDFIAEHREAIELKTNKEQNDRSDFDRLSAALLVADESLLDELGEILDIDAFLTFWVMEVITGHWDSYSGGRNNYLAYHDLMSDQFYFIPWGTDGAFSMQRPFTPGNTAATVLAQGLIASRLYNHPQGRMMYFDRLRDLFEQVWDEEALLQEADEIQMLTQAQPAAVEAQKSFIISHGAAIRSELEMAPVEWIGGDPPGARMCREDVATSVSGSFTTTWSATHTPRPGQNVDIILNGEPWMPNQLLGSAGLTPMESDVAQIRYMSPLSDGTLLLIALSIPMSLFQVGEHAMHGFETNGIVITVNPQRPSEAVLIGVIGDGFIQLDSVGTEDGDSVSGSFEGKFLQMRPF